MRLWRVLDEIELQSVVVPGDPDKGDEAVVRSLPGDAR